ncbi:MAG: permease [Caldilineaceae bacterium]|nr:permease [Caldilineaceae bacterium]
MGAGHFALAAGLKRWAPRLPLWVLILSAYLLDVIFIVLFAAGIESLAQIDPANPGYGGAIIHAYYTHSLVGALLIAAAAGLLASRWWGRGGGWIVAGVVFSHWLLDLVVHRPDMPILPGNAGNLPLLGLGLWQIPLASAAVELALVLGGAYLYYRSAARLPTPAGMTPVAQRQCVMTASVTVAVLLLLILISDVMGL